MLRVSRNMFNRSSFIEQNDQFRRPRASFSNSYGNPAKRNQHGADTRAFQTPRYDSIGLGVWG